MKNQPQFLSVSKPFVSFSYSAYACSFAVRLSLSSLCLRRSATPCLLLAKASFSFRLAPSSFYNVGALGLGNFCNTYLHTTTPPPFNHSFVSYCPFTLRSAASVFGCSPFSPYSLWYLHTRDTMHNIDTTRACAYTVEIVIMHIAGSISVLDYWAGEDAYGAGRPRKCLRTTRYALPID